MENPLAGKGTIAEKIFLSMKMREITTERRFDGPMLSLSVTMASAVVASELPILNRDSVNPFPSKGFPIDE